MAQVVVEMSGDESKLWRAYQKIIDQSKKLDQSHKETKRSSDDAYGPPAIAALGRYAAGIVSVTAAIGAMKQALDAVNAAEEQLAASQRQDAASVGKLAQLAMGDKETMRRLIAEAKASRRQGAGETLTAAADLQFEITSANYDRYRQQIAELRASYAVGDVAPMVVGAAAFEQNMTTAATGGFPNIVSMLLGAAGKSPGEIPGIALAGAEASGYGSFIGLRPQEVLAAAAVLSRAAGNPQEGGMFAKNLFAGLQEAIRKGTITQAPLQEMMQQAMGLEAKGMFETDIVGADIRKVGGYKFLRDALTSYQQTLQEIDAAVAGDKFTAVTKTYTVEPSLIAARARTQAEAAMEQSGPLYRAGVYKNLAETIEADILRQQADRGVPRWSRGLSYTAMNVAQWLQGPERWTNQAVGQVGAVSGDPLVSESVRQAVLEAAAALESAAQEFSNAQRQRASANMQPE